MPRMIVTYHYELRPEEKFTSLAHLIGREMLLECHNELEAGKATGIDRVTKEEYGSNLEGNVEDLLRRLKQHSYKPQPVRRAYIPKPGTEKMRPLGIPSYEDKLVQMAVTKILTAIYEQRFVETSYGYRPGRSQHDAIKALNLILHERPINFIVDVDVKGFFDSVDHDWMMKFINHDIVDPNILRLIKRFLRAGVMEDGEKYQTEEGTPQGGVISPILANVYLHYVQDLWFEKVVKKRLRGAAYMIRYADDSIFCFEREDDARYFYKLYQERLGRFGLEISEEKSKIIFFSLRNSRRKSESFDFLGFTHYIGRSQNNRRRVKRKTSNKKFKAKLAEFKIWLKDNIHTPIKDLIKALNSKLSGYYNYYGVTDNIFMLKDMRELVIKLLHKTLNRRSREDDYSWEYIKKLKEWYPIVRPRIKVSIFELRQERSCIL